MPQLEFVTFLSQIFWLFVFFSLVYIYSKYVTLPKIENIIKKRYEQTKGEEVLANSLMEEAKEIKEKYQKTIKINKKTSNEKIDKVYKEILKNENNQKNKVILKQKQELVEKEKKIEKEKEKLFEYVMKADEANKDTALHMASVKGHENIVQLLLNALDKEEKDKLLEFVMKENEHKQTALQLAQEKQHVEIVEILKSYIQ
jgi:F-type H+-transporting ATPase subunit b